MIINEFKSTLVASEVNKILIHHHASIYIDPTNNEMFTYSFIGSWVNELSNYYTRIGMIVHISKSKTKQHDTKLNSNKIEIFSLGPKASMWNRIQRMKDLEKACRKASVSYDCLIIRGITPRQYSIFKNVDVLRKYFLMVGSIADNKPKLGLTFSGLHAYIMHFVRKRELKIISKNSKVFANSPVVVEELRSKFKIESSFVPTNTITNKIVKAFIKRKWPNDKITILFCGRVVIDKGIFELLEAFYLLIRENRNFRLTIVGSIDSQVFLEIKKLAFYASIERFISYEGFIPFGENLLKFYENSDIYILPSYHEGFPHSIWEAAATSTPVITTAVGGIPGIVDINNVTFIEKKSVSQIVLAIKNILNNWEHTMIKAENLHNLLVANTVEKCVKKLVNEINKQ